MRIHRLSRRAQGPFLRLSCAAVTADSLTAARSDESGSGAHRPGSLLLDEVSELEPSCQPRLLHVFPDDTADPDAGARLISTTRRNLEEEMHAGRFREELYYRINGACLRLPPLRHRREDIPSLADYFLDKYAALFGRQRPTLGAPGLRTLLDHSWPGNVRELENAIERGVVLGTTDRILLEDLPESVLESEPAATAPGTKYHDAVAQTKKQIILNAMQQAKGSYTEAAKLLGVHPNYLHRLIRNLNLKEEVKR
jgi:DNA-binding NtrC family response regulator